MEFKVEIKVSTIHNNLEREYNMEDDGDWTDKGEKIEDMMNYLKAEAKNKKLPF